MSRRDPSSWTGGLEPVVRASEPPDGVYTLVDLATPGLDRVAALLAPHTGGVRKAVITSVHYALSVTMRAIVEPFAFDGLHVVAGPDQLGFLADATLEEFAYWIGDVDLAPAANAAAVGTTVGALLRPAIDAVRRRARVGRRGVELIVLDSLLNQTRRLARRRAADLDTAWVEELLDATGLHSDVPVRRLRVLVDEGPPVEFVVPRVCCVLSKDLGDHACPTCPKRPDDATRARVVAEWVRAMDDAEFLEVTGRHRVTAPNPRDRKQ